MTSELPGLADATSAPAAEVVKQNPEAFHGAAREFGKAAETVGKTVNLVLSPLRGLCWGWEQIGEYVESHLIDLLKNAKTDDLQTPDPLIAGPLLEHMRFAGNHPQLQEMFTNLLAAAMQRGRSDDTHPAFVEVLRQLSGSDALILNSIKMSETTGVVIIYEHDAAFAPENLKVEKAFALEEVIRELLHSELELYGLNLVRLGLVERYSVKVDYSLDRWFEYQQELCGAIYNQVSNGPNFRSFELLRLTTYGKAFLKSCVLSPTEADNYNERHEDALKQKKITIAEEYRKYLVPLADKLSELAPHSNDIDIPKQVSDLIDAIVHRRVNSEQPYEVDWTNLHFGITTQMNTYLMQVVYDNRFEIENLLNKLARSRFKVA